jgi:SAM-dependent methyltransferase
MSSDGSEHWKRLDSSWEKGRQRLWREHSDTINGLLLSRWYHAKQKDFVLKTDLFDEMCGKGSFSLFSSRTNQFLGIDISHATIRAARSNHADLTGIAADVRRLPFDDNTFDLIISNSTLDHFEKHEAISESLIEIFRVLRQDGELILTMDNLMNPVIALRNGLPYRIVKRLHLTPYYVGATLGPQGLCNQIVRTGFTVIKMDAVLHCPRALAVALAYVMERFAPLRLQRCFLRCLSYFEVLRYLPTRFFTGHFVAVRAAKRISDRPLRESGPKSAKL